MNEPIPSIKSLIVCDAIAQDLGSQKKIIVGIFDQIMAGSIPCVHPQMAVYFSGIDAEGSYKFRLDLVRLEEDQVIGRAELPLEVNNRLQPFEGGILLQGLTFPATGKYEFRLYANGTFLESKEVTVSLAQ